MTMGNSLNIPDHDPKTLPRVISDEMNKKMINICLACHADGMETRIGVIKTKDKIRRFVKEVFNTDPGIIFTWTTWDTSNSDIIIKDSDVTPFENVSNVFDVIVSVGCPFPFIPNDDFKLMCKLLKPNGIAMITSPPKKVNYRYRNMLSIRKEIYEFEDLGCTPRLIPVYQTKDSEQVLSVFIRENI